MFELTATICCEITIYTYINLYTECFEFFFVQSLKMSSNFELWPVCKYLKYMFESHISE